MENKSNKWNVFDYCLNLLNSIFLKLVNFAARSTSSSSFSRRRRASSSAYVFDVSKLICIENILTRCLHGNLIHFIYDRLSIYAIKQQ